MLRNESVETAAAVVGTYLHVGNCRQGGNQRGVGGRAFAVEEGGAYAYARQSFGMEIEWRNAYAAADEKYLAAYCGHAETASERRYHTHSVACGIIGKDVGCTSEGFYEKLEAFGIGMED